MTATMKLDLSELEAGYRDMASRVRNWRPVLKTYGVYMVGSTKKNFQEQGRPTRWRPVKVNTMLRRYLRTAGAKRLMTNAREVAAAKGGRGRFAPNAAVFKSGERGTGAVSTVAGFARSGRTGRVLRARHKGLNKIAQPGMVFRAAAVRYVAEGKILLDTGRLRSSITSAVTGPRTVAVGTNVKYASPHQFGSASQGIAERAFLVFQDEDGAMFGKLLRDHLFRMSGAGGDA